MRSFEDRNTIALADAIKRRERKARKEARPAPAHPTAKGQREPRQEDGGYLAWLHQDIPCIACLIEGGSRYTTPIEAAHQKLAIAAHGWKEGGGGKRTHDHRCVPLCRWHHQLAPGACDNGQRQFWDRLGLGDDVAQFCADLYAAFRSGRSGGVVVLDYASRRLRR